MTQHNDPGDLLGAAFWRVMPLDTDAAETREWLDAFDSLVREAGRDRGTYILRRLLDLDFFEKFGGGLIVRK